MIQEFRLVDVKSGFLVFLIALPLCVGIAAASSFPPISGIITAAIGGLLSSFFGSSRLTIKGPAAGLIAVVLSAVVELGEGNLHLGYRRCLAAGVLAALFQIIMAKYKAGEIANIFPPAVVHGMLAAIGVIIIAKQSHIFLGVVPYSMSPIDLILEMPASLSRANPEVVLIGFITCLMILILSSAPKKMIFHLPPVLIALIVVALLGLYWHFDEAHSYYFLGQKFDIGPQFLVQIPNSLLASITFPDFTALQSFSGIKYAVLLALIGSIESLLTVAAADSLDPKQRRSDLNGDLFSIGVGNLVSSLVGGLPMISEVVRSKANIDNGAQSQWSNWFHGLFLLIAVCFCGGIIHQIPLAALSAMLIIIGFRLSSPKEFKNTYLIGLDQIAIFTTTFICTLVMDLLIGVVLGVSLKLLLHVYRGVPLYNLMKPPIMVDEADQSIRISLKGHAIFLNYFYLIGQIEKSIVTKKRVIVDLAQASLVDHTILSKLHKLELCGSISLTGMDQLKSLSKHNLSTRLAY